MKRKFSCRRDTLTIRGHIWGEPGQNRTVIILSHGFLADEHMCYPYAKYLAEKGYTAVTYDFCGGGLRTKSDGRTRDMTVLTEKKDLEAVIRAVKTLLSPKKIFLFGCSQGGFVSALTAVELGREEISGLILFYPALCIPDDARRGKMMFYRFDPESIPDLLGKYPMKLGGDYARTVIHMDPYKAMGGYNGPVLLLHGTADPIVDISYSRRLKKIYSLCRYVELAGAGHGFSGKRDKQACEYLGRYMKVTAGF